MFDVVVIIPVYNEREVILDVIHDWKNTLNTLDIKYKIAIYNDGSKDDTQKVCENAFKHDEDIILVNKVNSGHGPTILQGYIEHINKATWLFQVDSDNEMTADKFIQLWNMRNQYDFLVGRRHARKQALARKITSLCSRFTVRVFTRNAIYDVNSPFRLMRTECFAKFLDYVPRNSLTPNVILSGLAGMYNLRSVEIFVNHNNRTTGEVSIKKWKLFTFALKAFFQTIVVLGSVRCRTLSFWKH